MSLTCHSGTPRLGKNYFLVRRQACLPAWALSVSNQRDKGITFGPLWRRWLSFQDLSLWAQKISDKEITLKSGRVVKMPLTSVGGFVDGKCIG